MNAAVASGGRSTDVFRLVAYGCKCRGGRTCHDCLLQAAEHRSHDRNGFGWPAQLMRVLEGGAAARCAARPLRLSLHTRKRPRGPRASPREAAARRSVSAFLAKLLPLEYVTPTFLCSSRCPRALGAGLSAGGLWSSWKRPDACQESGPPKAVGRRRLYVRTAGHPFNLM